MTGHIFNRVLFKKKRPRHTAALIRHKSETSLTAIIWLFSFGLIVLTGRQLLDELTEMSALKESISFYGLGLAAISVLTIAWSFFRLLRYRQGLTQKEEKQKNRAIDKPKLDEVDELVKFFSLSPEQIEAMKTLDKVKVHFRKPGVTATFPLTLLRELKHEHTLYLCS